MEEWEDGLEWVGERANIQDIDRRRGKSIPIKELIADFMESRGVGKKIETALHHEPLNFSAGKKPYELRYGCLGDGITVWNRLEKRDDSYVTLAHIDLDLSLDLAHSVKFHDKNMPLEIKKRILNIADVERLVPVLNKLNESWGKEMRRSEEEREQSDCDIAIKMLDGVKEKIGGREVGSVENCHPGVHFCFVTRGNAFGPISPTILFDQNEKRFSIGNCKDMLSAQLTKLYGEEASEKLEKVMQTILSFKVFDKSSFEGDLSVLPMLPGIGDKVEYCLKEGAEGIVGRVVETGEKKITLRMKKGNEVAVSLETGNFKVLPAEPEYREENALPRMTERSLVLER
jgi:hypothetical protein